MVTRINFDHDETVIEHDEDMFAHDSQFEFDVFQIEEAEIYDEELIAPMLEGWEEEYQRTSAPVLEAQMDVPSLYEYTILSIWELYTMIYHHAWYLHLHGFLLGVPARNLKRKVFAVITMMRPILMTTDEKKIIQMG
jgi:hypothetical protein